MASEDQSLPDPESATVERTNDVQRDPFQHSKRLDDSNSKSGWARLSSWLLISIVAVFLLAIILQICNWVFPEAGQVALFLAVGVLALALEVALFLRKTRRARSTARFPIRVPIALLLVFLAGLLVAFVPQLRVISVSIVSFAGESACPALGRALQDSDATVRQHAMQKLESIGTPASATLDQVLMADQVESGVEANVVRALFRMGPEGMAILERRLADRSASGVIMRIVPEFTEQSHVFIPELTKLALDGTSSRAVKIEAVEVLSTIGKPAVDSLVNIVEATDRRVQKSALTAIGSMGEDASDASPVLVTMLLDPANGLQREVADALVETCPIAREHEEGVHGIYSGSRGDLEAALQALFKLDDVYEGTAATYIKLRCDQWVNYDAWNLGPPDDLNALMDVASESETARQAMTLCAAELANRLREPSEMSDDVIRILARFGEAARDSISAETLRTLVVFTLSEEGKGSVDLKTVTDAIIAIDSPDFAFMTASLDDTSSIVQLWAIETLANSPCQPAVYLPHLVSLAKNAEESIRIASLGRLNAIAIDDHFRPNAETSASIKASAEGLLALVTDDQLDVASRKSLIEFLGYSGYEAAIPLLTQLQSDENAPEELRSAARTALELTEQNSGGTSQ